MELFLYGLCVIALAILIVHLIHRPMPDAARYLPNAGVSESSAASTPNPVGGLYSYDVDTMFQRMDSLSAATATAATAATAASTTSRRLLEARGVTTSMEQAILMQQPYN
jgi:hypothetical protein